MSNTVSRDIAGRCTACNFAEARRVGLKNGFQLLVCQRCRTLYTDNLQSSAGPPDYNDYYGPHNLSVNESVALRLREIVAGFSAYRSNNRLLDIGFGAGAFLLTARRDQWDAFGVEVSRSAYEYAKGQGFNVFNGQLAEAQYPDDHFDVIIASEILEHVPDPRTLTREIARILRPGGLFWATTPHGRGLSFHLINLRWSIISPPEHLQIFSRKGIRLMLRDAGFRRVRLRTHGFNPMEIVHVLRSPSAGEAAGAPAANAEESVAEGESVSHREDYYKLNEMLMQSPVRRGIKRMVNGVLNVGQMGDSLKIEAGL